MKLLVLATAIFTLTSAPAFAWICSEPSAPYCSKSYGPFNSGFDFDQCKSEMERYASDVEDYLECLNRNSNTAIDTYNSAIEDFNRRAAQGL